MHKTEQTESDRDEIVKLAFIEKYEFEYPENSISKALSGIFGLSEFSCKDTLKRFPNLLLLNGVHSFIEISRKKNKPVVAEKKRVGISI